MTKNAFFSQISLFLHDDKGLTTYPKTSTRMPIYANYPSIFTQREYENHFCQVIQKSGRIFKKKARNL